MKYFVGVEGSLSKALQMWELQGGRDILWQTNLGGPLLPTWLEERSRTPEGAAHGNRAAE